MIFNERLRQLRKERNVTQEVAAKGVGITTRAYQRLEANGKPNYDGLLSIANYYKVSVDWLMGRTDRREVNR